MQRYTIIRVGSCSTYSSIGKDGEFTSRKILIETGQDEEEQFDTMWHEVIHGILACSGRDDWDEEGVRPENSYLLRDNDLRIR